MDHGTRADQHRAVWNRVVWNAAALVCAGQAHAADLTFDANGASPPDPVGTGAWETTAASWFDGAGFRAWDNTGLHRAVFGAPGTVTLAMPIVAGSLDFRADTTLSGSYLLTLAGTRGITLGEHATAAISAPLTGGFRLSGAATGLLQITGNNAGLYAGTTVLGRGPRLQLGHASALGSATHADALVLEDGARLEFANAATYAYDYTLTGGTARIVPRASSGVFSGAPTLTAPTTLVYGAANTGSQDWKGRLADTGPHALSFTVEAAEGYGPTLFAPNAWSGDTRLRSGQLALANAAALSPDTAVVFDGIGEVQATLVFNYGGTFARTLGHGPGQFRWEGSGGFRSNVGTMTVSFDGDAPLTWGAGGFVPDGRSLHVGGGVVLTNAIDLGALQRTVFGNGTIAGALHGEGGGLRLREGLLTLTAANTWTGATVLDARRGNVFDAQLALGHGQALPGGVGLEGGTSALVLDGGIVLLGPKSGDFLRGLGDGSHQVRFTGSGGFGSASGVRTVDIGGAGETLAWGRDGFVPVGSSLAFAGSANASVVFRNGIDLAGEERTIELASSGIAPQRAVRFEGRFTDGALRLLGFGDAALTGANTYAGRTVIGASDVSTRATIDTLADGGNASGIGASDADAANLVFGSRGANSVATLAYIGGDARTDRDFTMLGNAELLSDGSGAMAWHGAPTVAAGTHTLRLGGATKGNLFAGTLQDGGGRLSLAKHGAGTWRLTGTNTFTGGVRIGGVGNGAPDPGVLEVTALNDAHEAGSLGINASNQASNLTLYSRGVLRYVGDGDSTNRNLMRGLQSGALADRTHGIALESSGSGALEWRGTVTMQNTGNAWLRLGGTHAGDNRFASVLANSAQAVSLAKEGSGTWSLAGANTYTGATEIVDGLLRLAHANALPGGLGADDTSGSPLRLAGGILGLTAASGDLHRKLGAGAGRNALAWTGTHGGFAAFDGTRVVDLGGAGATLTWTAPHYLADGARLQLSHQSADATLDFRNGIDFAGAERVVEVADGTHALDGVLSGVLSGSGAAGLAKTGAGTLRITGDNTYAGRTRLDEGVLEVERIGHAGSVGNLGLGSGGADALHIDGATLRHVGAGDTSNRGFTIGARGATIAADGYGAMSLDGDVASADATQVRTLWLTGGSLLGNRLGGTLGASGALAVEKQGVGTWVLAGDSTLAQLSIRAGTLQLGDHGTSGSVGDIAIDNHGTLAFARSDVAVFANAIDGPGALAQRGTGTTVLSAQGSRAGRVHVAQGALQVDGTLEAAHVDLGAGTLRILGQMHGSAGHEVTFGDADGADGVLAVETGGQLRARGTLGGGDDVLHLADDAVLAGTIDGGDAMLGDTVRLDSQRALVFQPASVTGFERLRKTGDGIATTRGAGAYEHGVSVEAGTLRVDAGAALQAPTFGVADGATLAIDGEASGAAGGSAHTTGDAGTSTVRIGAGGWLVASAALGAGTDTLDVAGRLDIGDGRFDLGDGDDVFVVHDGTHVTGAVEGGAGQDTRAYAIESHATLGSLLGFEALEKRGGGILDVLGGASTALAEVGVLGGTLRVGAAATIDGVAVTTIANGATLQVDGRFLGTAGDDTIAIAGVLSGQGSVDLGMGDDTLLIGDGAILHNVVEGGTALHADRVVLDNSRAMTFDAAQVRGFERLQKRNTGVATLTGAHSEHAAGVDIQDGTLVVGAGHHLEASAIAIGDGAILRVGHVASRSGGSATHVSGDAGVNTVRVDAGGTLHATGDLGDGDDVLDVAGTLDLHGGRFALGDGDDRFVVHDGTHVLGTVDGGAGRDTRVYDIAGQATLGALQGFEGLEKRGDGTLRIDGPDATGLEDVEVLGGTLHVRAAGAIEGVLQSRVAHAASLQVDGRFAGSAGADTMTVAGVVLGSGRVDLGAGNDMLVLQDGADLSGLSQALAGGDGEDTLHVDIAGTTALAGVTQFERLDKRGTGTLQILGVAPSDFASVAVDAGTVEVGAAGSITDVVDTHIAAGATLHVEGHYAGSGGDDTLTVAGRLSGSATVDLADGDDTLIVREGAEFANRVAGGAGSDTLLLDNVAALAFEAGEHSDFERLHKRNTGTAVLVGAQTSAYTEGVRIDAGTLVVDASHALRTPTLHIAGGASLAVEGLASRDDGTALHVAGDAGANVVRVGSSGTLIATGDLGDGDDVLDVGGLLDIGGGAFMLGDGDDRFIVRDGTRVLGTVDGGTGEDTRDYDIAGEAHLGALRNFEVLAKHGSGTLHVDGPDATALARVEVRAGMLSVGAGGAIVDVADARIDAGATLRVDGAFTGSANADTLLVAGAVSGHGIVSLDAGDDALILRDGAVLAATIDGGAQEIADTLVLEADVALAFDGHDAVGFEALHKRGTGLATLVGAHRSHHDDVRIDAGTLAVDAVHALETPSLAIADGGTLQVDGRVSGVAGEGVTLAGDAGANQLRIARGGVVHANVDFGAGEDRLEVAGVLSGHGATLGEGDDALVLHDGADLSGLASAIDGGGGRDRLQVDFTGTATLGGAVGFEALRKTNVGNLRIAGPAASTFSDIQVQEGRIEVGAAGRIEGVQTLVVDGSATLDNAGRIDFTAAADSVRVDGTLVSTGALHLGAGDDVLWSAGDVAGGIAFGDGDDEARFTGGRFSTLALDGGRGTGDRLAFVGLSMDAADLPTFTGFERVQLASGTTLALAGAPLALDGGTLAIDASSVLSGRSAARIAGHVENAGRIDTLRARIGVDGDYTGGDGAALLVEVATSAGTAGGLDIGGGVHGRTAVVFRGDGTSGFSPASITVVSAPGAGEAVEDAFFAAETEDSFVRLAGSPYSWTFARDATHAWSLTTGSTPTLVPELPGIAVLPTLGFAAAEDAQRVVFDRLAAMRGEASRCEASHPLSPDCRDAWVAAVDSELTVGPGPGFGLRGHTRGLIAGVDRAMPSGEGLAFRAGAHAGVLRGDHTTAGGGHEDLRIGAARLRTSTPLAGFHASIAGTGGRTLEATLDAQRSRTQVFTGDGWFDTFTGSRLALRMQATQRFAAHGWALEPHLALGLVAQQWGDRYDAGGRDVLVGDDVVGQARIGLRVERTWAAWRPWATLAVEDTFGEGREALRLRGTAGETFALPGHDLRHGGTLEAGLEGRLPGGLQVFGSVTMGERGSGTSVSRRSATLGARWAW